MSNPDPRIKNLKPFKKGDPRINRRGRKPGTKNRSTITKRWLEAQEEIKNPITKETERLTMEDTITLAQIGEARKGSTRAYVALMESCYGKLKREAEPTEQELDSQAERLSEEDMAIFDRIVGFNSKGRSVNPSQEATSAATNV